MKLSVLRISNFQCFGPDAQAITFDDSTTMIIGPNGSGKTAILQALGRMFDADLSGRRVREGDFHVPVNEVSAPPERSFTIEADFVLPEAENADDNVNTIPPCFNHMRLDDAGEILKIRFKLEATMGVDGDIEEKLHYVIGKEDNGEDKLKKVPRADRNLIAVYYIPARRNPSDHIRASSTSLINKIVRAIDWSEQAELFGEAATGLQESIRANPSVRKTSERISQNWSLMHKGSHFKDASIAFNDDGIESILQNFSIKFSPAHTGENVDYSLLSDGQKSLLYLSLVISYIEVGRFVMNPGELGSAKIGVDKLNPPIFSLIAIEEPENSLSPHYLGRINKVLAEISRENDAQAIVATHAPTMLKRIDPDRIRHIRLGSNRTSNVKKIVLPDKVDMDAYKFIREGLLSNPEIYFARMVVLGEGASEDIVLPKLFESEGLPLDENGIVLAQLGGRHVNYLWKILTELEIPFATLLDLDLGRHQGGWGRVKYVRDQLIKIGEAANNGDLPKWNETSPLELESDNNSYGSKWFSFLKDKGVFFSRPLDLDFTMLQCFPGAFGFDIDFESVPDESTCKSVLGSGYDKIDWYSDDEKRCFSEYHKLFKMGSKPAAHIEALSNLDCGEIEKSLPNQYKELIEYVSVKLGEVYE